MSATYQTLIVGEGNHASLEVPDLVLAELGANRRAPLRITVNGHTYQSTATGVGGRCMVVFPMRDRDAAGVSAGQVVTVTLELDSGHREVDLPPELEAALGAAALRATFEAMTYSNRRTMARSVADAKTEATRARRVSVAIEKLKGLSS